MQTQAGAPPQTVSSQKLKATISSLRQDSSLWPALLVALGALCMLSLFPFYPWWVSALLAGVCGAVAYHKPPFATLFSVLLAFPAVVYQAPLFGWVYLLVISITLFEFLDSWAIISFLQIVICSPFAPFPLSLLAGFVPLFLAMGALYIGSERSMLIAIPAVLIILMLSTIWMVPNGAFMLTGSLERYAPAVDGLSKSLPPPEINDIGPAFVSRASELISWKTMGSVGSTLGKLASNMMVLLNPLEDAGLIQLISWAAVLFLVGALPMLIKGEHKQAMAGFALLLVPITHYAISLLYPIAFPQEFLIYLVVSLAILYVLEHYKVELSRERLLQKNKKAKTFGKLGIEDLSNSEGPSSLDEVGGYQDVKDELKEAIVTPLQNKELAITYNIKPASGILLFGPPGTGKTMLMRALSKELNIGFYYVKCSELLSEWYGESEKNVTELFSAARKNAPCILFFDEIDSIAKRRDKYSADDVGPRVMSVLLAEMDGFKGSDDKKVIVIGATNMPDQLDSAIMRPGRLDKIIYMHLPDREARLAIFKVHSRKVPLDNDIDFAKLADMTERFSGADISNAVSEAIRLAAREAASKDSIIPISQKHFASVLKRIRPSTSLESLASFETFKMDFERRTMSAEPEEDKNAVQWEDVVGLDDVRTALKEAIELPLLHEDLIKQYKIKPAKGLLLFGPPGCGKTMIVRAASSQLNAHFLSVSGADLIKNGPSMAEKSLKDIFNRAREQSPALIFIDEIESLAPSRSQFSSPVLTQLLQELDGVVGLKNVMVVGATNKPAQIDSALLRPGRFDKILYIPPPDHAGRAALFQKHLGAVAPGLDFNALSSHSAGYSGADIAGICQEAKMLIVRSKIAGKPIELASSAGMQEFGQFIYSILSKRKPSITKSDLLEYRQFVDEYGERR